MLWPFRFPDWKVFLCFRLIVLLSIVTPFGIATKLYDQKKSTLALGMG